MLKKVQACLFLVALATTSSAAEQAYSEGGTTQCRTCHSADAGSPIHAMLAGAHGQTDDGNTPMSLRGCEECHGPSAGHTRAPTQVSPGVSFGPRRTASTAVQDKQCLACHETDVARRWADALHRVNNLTCVSCHDIHENEDKVLHGKSQSEVCTLCHKTQKAGIHGLVELGEDNPSCSSCHNPHDEPSALIAMLENRSEGCRSCHDLVQMSDNIAVTDKAKSYHKVMAHPDRTCVDCHRSISHSSPNAVPPLVPEAQMSRTVRLFYPGKSDSEWLLTEHPGSQPLRQGSNCRQCHRGEEAIMAEALNGEISPKLRELVVTFISDDKALFVTLSWNGPIDEADIAMMWGDNNNDAFRRGGCFAACHNDMPGMSRDRGQELGKYLVESRAQQQHIGQPAIVKKPAELREMIAQGNFVEMWRVQLNAGEPRIQTATLLAELNWSEAGLLTGTARHSDGRWTVHLQRPLIAGSGYKDFRSTDRYTLGLALHGKNNPGGKHWVSLPMTLSLSDDDTDFNTEK